MRGDAAVNLAALERMGGVPIADGGYSILRISKVLDEPVKEGDPQLAAQAAQLYGGAQYEAFVESLRAQADIEINAATLEKKQ